MSATPDMETPIEPRREAGRGLPGFPAAPLPADRFGRRFRVGMALLLLAMLVLYWAMWRWEETAWFAKEDGIVEYATAALLAVGALACVLAGRVLRRMGHRHLALFHYLAALAFAVGALEEISWGQRIFGWETPGAISDVNRQGETTLHNISWLETPVYTVVAWMSILAIAGAAVRVVLHLGRRVTTADLILPAAVTVPLLAINLLWTSDALRDVLHALPYRADGSEYGDFALALAVGLFGFGAWRRAAALRREQPPPPPTRTSPEPQTQ